MDLAEVTLAIDTRPIADAVTQLDKLDAAGKRVGATTDGMEKIYKRTGLTYAEMNARADEHARKQQNVTSIVAEATKKCDDHVAALRKEAEVLGLNALQIKAYELAHMQLSDAQRASAEASLQAIAAYERQQQTMQSVTRYAIAGATAVLGLAAAFAYKVERTIMAAAALDTLSQKTGIAVERLTALDYAAKVSDTSIESLARAMSHLPRSLIEGGNRNSEAGRAFSFLGIDPSSLRTQEQAINAIADAIKRVEDPMAKSAALQMVFKQSGEELIPFFNQGADGLRRLATEGEYWNKISGETAAEAKRLKEQMATLELASGSFARSIAADVVPVMNKLLEQFLTMKREFGTGGALALMVGTTTSNVTGQLHDIEKTLGVLRQQREDLKKDTLGNRINNALPWPLGGDLADTDRQIKALEAQQKFMRLVLSQQQQARRAMADAQDAARDMEGSGRRDQISGMPDSRGSVGSTAAGPDNPFRQLMADLERKLELDKESTEIDKLLVQLDTMRGDAYAKLTIAQLANLEATAHEVDLKKQGAAQDKYFADTRAAVTAAENAELNRLNSSIAAQQLRNAEIGKTAEQKALEKAAIEDAATAQLQAEADALRFAAETVDMAQQFKDIYILRANALDSEIEKRKQLAALIRQGADLEAQDAISKKIAADAKKVEQESKRLVDSIDHDAHSAFVHMFDTLGGGWDDLLKSMAASFKRTLADFVYQAFVRPIVLQFVATAAGGLGLSGISNAALAAAGGGSAGGSALNLLSTGNSLYSNLSSGSANLIGRAGNFFEGTQAAAPVSEAIISEVGPQALGFLGGAGVEALPLAAEVAVPEALGALGGAGVLSQGVAGGAGALGAGGALGAIAAAAPYVAIAIAAASALGLFGGGTKAVGTGLRHTGSFGLGTGLDLTSEGFTNVGPEVPASLPNYPPFVKAITPVIEDLQKLAKMLDLDVTGLRGHFQVSANAVGQSVTDSLLPEVALQVAGDIATQLVPELKDLQKENESLVGTFARVATAFQLTTALAQTFGGQFEEVFAKTGSATFALRTQLVELMGGIDNARAATGAYYQEFFTESERLVAAQRQVNVALAELGVTTLPRTRTEFRRLVEAQDLTTRSGQEMFAALLQIAPAFAAVTAAVIETGNAMGSLVDQLTAVRKQTLDAIDAQTKASEQSASTAHQAADAYRSLSATLRDSLIQIRGGDLSPLLPGQKLEESRTNLDQVFAQALGGDQGALAKLPQFATDFLTASRAFNASSEAYTRDFLHVMDILAQAQGSSTQAAGHQDYLSGLLDIQTNVLKEIKDELGKPSPDTAAIEQQTQILTAVRTLLNDQNGLSIAGNSTADAIRNINFLNNNLSAETLTALLRDTASQGDQFGTMIGGLNKIADLMQQQVILAQHLAADEQAKQLQAAADAARIAAEAQAAAAAAKARADSAAVEKAQSVITPATLAPQLPSGVFFANGHWNQRISEDLTIPILVPPPGFDEMGNAIPSHAGGLPSVPYDDYLMHAHADEAVVDADAKKAIKRYFNADVKDSRGSDINKADIDRLCAAVERGNAILMESAYQASLDLEKQTKSIERSGKENVRQFAHFVEGATAARVRL